MVSNDGVTGSGNLGSVSASEIAIIITPLFTKLPWPGDSEETFRSSSQAVYHVRWRLYTVLLMLNVMHGSCEYQFLWSVV